MVISSDADGREPNKLILCLDGTGNTFSGSNADTNVVKILNKLDRHHPRQFHYYQTGVGTYDINERSIHKTYWESFRSSISRTLDQAVGTTFDAHVMAAYRFLMRYYEPGDKIYLFGFSRGAFTARFLARMVSTVGLLCKGNEEMVPFAYLLYQRYLAGEVDDFDKTSLRPGQSVEPACGETEPLLGQDTDCDDETHTHTFELARNEIVAFSNTFCRKEQSLVNGEIKEENVKVYFLGLWDCVNSVSVLERNSPLPVPVMGNAHYVRHAVAVDERRVKFKPALIAQDVRCTTQAVEDIKEVWFPGCHGDVGGGWPASAHDNEEDKGEVGFWQSLRSFWRTNRPQEATKDIRSDAFQMSDVSLSWMIRELELVAEADPKAAVKWSKNAAGYKRAFARPTSQKQALKGFMHDSLSFGTGTGVGTVLLWKFMELLPIITRWELVGNNWEKTRFPLNKGSFRDIPKDAVLHESLIYRLKNVTGYSPGNNHGGSLPPCLKSNGIVADFEPIHEATHRADPAHQTYRFRAEPDGFVEEPTTSKKAAKSCIVM